MIVEGGTEKQAIHSRHAPPIWCAGSRILILVSENEAHQIPTIWDMSTSRSRMFVCAMNHIFVVGFDVGVLLALYLRFP